jgi:RNA polymerase sigma factor for flagellar operon FliA
MLKMFSKPTSQWNIGDAVERQRLVLENLTEVRYIARRIKERLPSQVSFGDLVQAGILGLIDAIDKFDPEKNVQFMSYARFRIRGAILDSLRLMDWAPRNLRRQAHRLEQASRELIGELGHSPSASEIASKLGLPVEDVQRLLGDLRGLRLESLQIWPDEGTGEEALPVAFRPEEDPFQMAFRLETRHLLEEALSELDEKEADVLGLYYFEELNMKDIGMILGVGESRVSQIHAAALVHLRSLLVPFQPRFQEPASATPANAGEVTPIEWPGAVSRVYDMCAIERTLRSRVD